MSNVLLHNRYVAVLIHPSHRQLSRAYQEIKGGNKKECPTKTNPPLALFSYIRTPYHESCEKSLCGPGGKTPESPRVRNNASSSLVPSFQRSSYHYLPSYTSVTMFSHTNHTHIHKVYGVYLYCILLIRHWGDFPRQDPRNSWGYLRIRGITSAADMSQKSTTYA